MSMSQLDPEAQYCTSLLLTLIYLNTRYWRKPTAVLRNVDVHAELWDPAAWKVGHAAVGGQIPEIHVHDLQAAGAGRQVRIAAQDDQAVRAQDGRAVFVPAVVDLVLRGRVHVTGQLEVAAHLDGLAVFVGVGGDLEGQVGHRCQGEEIRKSERRR